MRARISLVSLILTLAAAPAIGEWIPNGTPVCTAPLSQTSPRAVSDGAGGMIVTWLDLRNGNAQIFAQRINGSGVVAWTLNGVMVDPTIIARFGGSLSITSDGAGGAIVSWVDARTGTNQVFAQRVDASGATLWTAGGVPLAGPGGAQTAPIAEPDGAGGAVFAFQDTRNQAAGDITAQRLDGSGNRLWGTNGVVVCGAANAQLNPAVLSDGAGAATIAWGDVRNGSHGDLYVQRINAAGVAQWTPDGVALSTALEHQQTPNLVTDGAGGAIVGWTNFDGGATYTTYAQRVNGSGAAQWTSGGIALGIGRSKPRMTADGAGGAVILAEGGFPEFDIYATRRSATGASQWIVPLTTLPGNQGSLGLESDNAGGWVVLWNDGLSATPDLYAQRLSASGASQWTPGGVVSYDSTRSHFVQSAVTDGHGGMLFTGGAGADVYAERLFVRGLTGPFAASILDVEDRPADQGGWVRVRLDAAPADSARFIQTVTTYNLWRRIDSPGVVSEPLTPEAVGRSLIGRVTITSDGGGEFPPGAWESLGLTAATQSGSYVFAAATTDDSTAAGIPEDVFVVSVHTPVPWLYLVSDPDSGYSVDNLPPQMPQPFTASVSGGGTHLHWNPNGEHDLDGYRLHRGASADFVPGPGNLISAQSDTGHTDAGQFGSFYKLAAVDEHGNLSAYALVSPPPAGVDPAVLPTHLMLAAPRPNPLAGSCLVPFALPSAGTAALDVFDGAGRFVRTLAARHFEAGAHAVTWDGADRNGRPVTAGMYWIRLTAGGARRAVRALVVR